MIEVSKARSYLEGKLEGDNSMIGKSLVSLKRLGQEARQLGRTWLGLDYPNPNPREPTDVPPDDGLPVCGVSEYSYEAR